MRWPTPFCIHGNHSLIFRSSSCRNNRSSLDPQSPGRSQAIGTQSPYPSDQSILYRSPSQIPESATHSRRSLMHIDQLLTPPELVRDLPRESLRQGTAVKRARGSSFQSSSDAFVPLLERAVPNVNQEFITEVDPDYRLNLGVDPYQLDPDLTKHYLGHYFTNINATSYLLFPRKQFLSWVEGCSEKGNGDRILIYTMLAHGTSFSCRPESRALGQHFTRISREAVGQNAGMFSLPLVQSRLLLALLEYALGNCSQAWDYCGAAIRAAYALQLNAEKCLHDVQGGPVLEYGFDQPILTECRRRTFWLAYIMDRFSSFCSGRPFMIQNADCLSRLPCTERQYESGSIPPTPFLHDVLVDTDNSVEAEAADPSAMAFLVHIASISGDVSTRAWRSEHRAVEKLDMSFEQFYQKQTITLQRWKHRLEEHTISSD